MLRIGVLCSGGGTNLQALLDAEAAGTLQAEVAVVIASKPDAYALERAKARGVPGVYIGKKGYKTPGAYEKRLLEELWDRGVGLVITAGFTVVLDESFIAAYPQGIMNVHPSLIPSFCGKGMYGLKVHEAALGYGVKVTGATVHFVTEVLDGGPVILQTPVAVREGDTPEALQRRVMEEGEWKILPEAVRLFAEGRLKVINGVVSILTHSEVKQ